MKNQAIIGGVLALAMLLPLAACSPSDHASNSDVAQAMKEVQQQTSPSVIGAEVQKGIDHAKQQLLTQNIDVDSVHIGGTNQPASGAKLPKAVITPQGDLLIAGRQIAATPGQHALLLDYRKQLIGIADAGMDIGASGADLGMHAAEEAIWGALSGKSDRQIDAAIQPQADKIKAAAVQMCKRMPALLAAQRKLAAALPALKPYATMTQQDVDDCGKDIDDNGKQGSAVFSH